MPPRDIRELRDLVRRRAFLVGMRTKLKNRAHAELAKRGIDLGIPLFTRDGLGLLRSLELEAVEQLLPVIESLDKQIRPDLRQPEEDERRGPEGRAPHHHTWGRLLRGDASGVWRSGTSSGSPTPRSSAATLG